MARIRAEIQTRDWQSIQYIYPLDHHNDLLQTLQFLEFVNLVRQFFLLSTHLQPFFSVKKHYTVYLNLNFLFCSPWCWCWEFNGCCPPLMIRERYSTQLLPAHCWRRISRKTVKNCMRILGKESVPDWNMFGRVESCQAVTEKKTVFRMCFY